MIDLKEEFYAKFDKIEKDFDELQSLISSVEIIADNKLFNYYKKNTIKFTKFLQCIKIIKIFANNLKKIIVY